MEGIRDALVFLLFVFFFFLVIYILVGKPIVIWIYMIIAWIFLSVFVGKEWEWKGMEFGTGFMFSFLLSPVAAMLFGIFHVLEGKEVKKREKKEEMEKVIKEEKEPVEKKKEPEKKGWEKVLEESGAEYFDIGLDSMLVFKDDGVRILRDLGYYAKEAGELIDSIPVILMENIPKSEVKKICRKLEKAFKIDLIPKKGGKK
ncbi:hypothetical protein DRQ18_02910 [bacterium]|nr:MAG: hypothetical protein DRQ18_02910 [bacterium]